MHRDFSFIGNVLLGIRFGPLGRVGSWRHSDALLQAESGEGEVYKTTARYTHRLPSKGKGEGEGRYRECGWGKKGQGRIDALWSRK